MKKKSMSKLKIKEQALPKTVGEFEKLYGIALDANPNTTLVAYLKKQGFNDFSASIELLNKKFRNA